jgi:hypothetical protein
MDNTNYLMATKLMDNRNMDINSFDKADKLHKLGVDSGNTKLAMDKQSPFYYPS